MLYYIKFLMTPRGIFMAMKEEEVKLLKEELEEFKKEKEQIRNFIGQIGGAGGERRDKIFNVVFIIALIALFLTDILRHFGALKITFIPEMLSLETGVLLVSLKIIWMIHKQTKVEHFQFWILNSIEFRLNDISKRVRKIEKDTCNSDSK
jgi:hypothetical protein